jgi:hypothetical protein
MHSLQFFSDDCWCLGEPEDDPPEEPENAVSNE